MRKLVVNADDFGFTHDVNLGIIEAHTQGILTATTLMANGGAFSDAVQLAQQHPTLDVGCHLVLVGGPSLSMPGTPLPPTVGKMIAAVLSGRLDPYRELKLQIDKIMDAGLRPIHLDSHKHTHLFPPVLNAVATLSQEFGIPWVRRPFDFPIDAHGVPRSKQLVNKLVQSVRTRVHRTLASHGCRTTDHFAGFQWTGRFRSAELIRLAKILPEGSTEFMCHPGRCTDELRCQRTRLKESREEELAALVDPQVRLALEEAQVEIVRYRDL